MCGRFALYLSKQRLQQTFGVEMPDVEPRYNVSPTQPVLTIRAADGIRTAAMLRWGLVPSWADDPKIGSRLINARADTVATKPSFRSAFKRRRCLIPADAFYEWQATGTKKKQPHCIRMKDKSPFAFAGLWEQWERDGQTLESCCIITTEANAVLEPIHDRMPVILPARDYDLWIDPAISEPGKLTPLLCPYPADQMTRSPVGDPRFLTTLDGIAS
jgi:putative SOS response-associated peptidase YedK